MDHLSQTDTIKAQLEEFLLFGDDSNSISALQIDAKSFLQKWELIRDEGQEFNETLKCIVEKAESQKARVERIDVVSLFRNYVTKQTEIQLIMVAKSLTKLQQFHSVLEIPELVLEVIRTIPTNISPNLKIFKILTETVTSLKATLLPDFHDKFEKHMDSSQEYGDPQKAWSQFLSSARDWLLAYTMVCLLPHTLSDKTLLMEKYQDTLDTVFTPLWGRFHFHLSSARSTKSSEQLLWTFHYARIFFHMLCNLCTEITSSNQLQRLHSANYKDAGMQYIVDKMARFMRAHLAQIIVDNSPLTSSLCLQLVECALELDDTLAEVSTPALFIVAVISDAKSLISQWIAADKTFFSESAVAACTLTESQSQQQSETETAYCCRFSSEATDNGPVRVRCFNALYDCLSLTVLASRRYANLPPQIQNIFCETVIEPLICVCLGIILMRVRTCTVLCDMARGTLPFWQPSSRPNDMNMVVDSSRYLADVLGAAVISTLSAKEGRFESRWKVLRVWISEAAKAGVSLRALPEYIMSSIEVNDGNISVTAVVETGKISSAIAVAKTHSTALCNALEEQYQDAILKIKK
eukprot:gene1926-3739_t